MNYYVRLKHQYEQQQQRTNILMIYNKSKLDIYLEYLKRLLEYTVSSIYRSYHQHMFECFHSNEFINQTPY